MGVGEEGKAPSILKFDVFPSNFSQKKLFSQFRVENEILPLLSPLQKYFWATPGH